MQKFVFSFSFFFSSLFASFVGNCYDPAIIQEGIFVPDTSPVQCKIEGVFDAIFCKKYSAKSELINGLRSKSFAKGGGAVFSFFERVEVYGYVFSGKNKITMHAFSQKKSFSPKGNAYCAGGKVDLIEMKSFFLGFDVKYLFSKAHNSRKEKLKNSEWQISSEIMYQSASFFPYLGITVNGANLRLKKLQDFPFSRIEAQEKNHVGMVLGSSFSPRKKINFTVEGRFFQETALSMFLQIQF